MLINSIKWKSSVDNHDEELKALDIKMSDFYSRMESRASYQEMVDCSHLDGEPVSMYTSVVAEFVNSKKYNSVLEVGCGNGQFYKLLLENGYAGRFTGVEMAPDIIENNGRKFPKANWFSHSVYRIESIEGMFDCCVSLFVLEHLVFPEKALVAMLSKVNPGGELVLVFPDFRESTIFPSQRIGIRHGKLSTKEKLKKFLLFDAICGYIEGRIVAGKLSSVNRVYGDFVVNLEPYCLVESELFPDSDAVYISNREEIARWANSKGLEVSYPRGVKGEFAINAFMALRKPI